MWSKQTFIEHVTRFTAALGNSIEEGIEEAKAAVTAEKTRALAAEAKLEAQIAELGGAAPGTPTGGKLLFGINSNSSKGHYLTWTAAKVYVDRSDSLDVEYTASPESVSAAVATSIARGCKPVVIINTPDGEVLGKVSATAYAAGALAIIERVLRDHPTANVFELINEPYYKGSSPNGSKIGSNGIVYGAIAKKAYEVVEGAGLLGRVTLLLTSYGEYNSYANLSKEEKQEQSGVFHYWTKEICEAFGVYKTAINGWSTHPYGGTGAANGEKNNNWGAVETHRATAIELGAGGTSNWWITEIGSQGETLQNERTKGQLEKALAAFNAGWLKAIVFYDDGDGEWTMWGKPSGALLREFATANG